MRRPLRASTTCEVTRPSRPRTVSRQTRPPPARHSWMRRTSPPNSRPSRPGRTTSPDLTAACCSPCDRHAPCACTADPNVGAARINNNPTRTRRAKMSMGAIVQWACESALNTSSSKVRKELNASTPDRQSPRRTVCPRQRYAHAPDAWFPQCRAVTTRWARRRDRIRQSRRYPSFGMPPASRLSREIRSLRRRA